MHCSGYVEQQYGAMAPFEQQENIKFCQKLGTYASKTFQMIRQTYKHTVKKPWAVVLYLSGTNILHRVETVFKMMSIPVSQEVAVV
jgi:hypothetical protein